MSGFVCQTCGGPTGWYPGRSGKKPRFCSDKCRKASYAGACVDCSTPTNGHDGPGQASNRCVGCANRRSIETGRADMARAREKRQRVVAMWAAGLLMRDIAAAMGWSMDHLSVEMARMRKLGYDLPHRYRAYDENAAAPIHFNSTSSRAA